jgi:hypothetical protein
MRRRVTKSILIFLLVSTCRPSTAARENDPNGHLNNLDRAIVFAVYLEAHASRLENREDVCIGFGHGLAVNEKEILSELKIRKIKVHSNDWCNRGPRGLVISVIAPITESTPGTYELEVQVGDLRAIREGSEHFGTLLRRGTYTVKCKDNPEPELVKYQEAVLPGNP